MADTANLFIDGRDKGAKATASNSQDFTTGILPSQTIHLLIDAGDIQSDTPIPDGQIQPASIDLRLGNVAYRVRGSFLPARTLPCAAG